MSDSGADLITDLDMAAGQSIVIPPGFFFRYNNIAYDVAEAYTGTVFPGFSLLAGEAIGPDIGPDLITYDGSTPALQGDAGGDLQPFSLSP